MQCRQRGEKGKEGKYGQDGTEVSFVGVRSNLNDAVEKTSSEAGSISSPTERKGYRRTIESRFDREQPAEEREVSTGRGAEQTASQSLQLSNRASLSWSTRHKRS